MSKFSKLSRAEMKNVLGGYVDPSEDPNASCTAQCDNDAKHDVTCKGTNCHATKGSGCKSDTEKHDCPTSNS